MISIDEMLTTVRDRSATDLHLSEGSPPKLRIRGELTPLNGPDHVEAVDHGELIHAMYEILTPDQVDCYEQTGDLDFAYSLEGVARFRCNYLQQVNGVGAVFRLIPDRISTLEELDMPKAMTHLAHLKGGLVLVTGPSGSGKSTTQAAILDVINRSYKKHIITIEQPIEFVHENKESVITQREVGLHTDSFAAALRAAVREDPDVVLVGEMRDLETIALALTAAELGLLVFGTLHTNSAAKTIDRIIDVFPYEQQPQVRTMLSESLQAVVSQLLLRSKNGTGRVAAIELLTRKEGLGNMIREGTISKIVSLMETSHGEGMQLMDQALLELVKANKVDAEEAYMKAGNKGLFEPYRKAGAGAN